MKTELETKILIDSVPYCKQPAVKIVVAMLPFTELSATGNDGEAAELARFPQHRARKANEIIVRNFANQLTGADLQQSLMATESEGQPVLISSTNSTFNPDQIFVAWKKHGLDPKFVISIFEVHRTSRGVETAEDFANSTASLEKQGLGYQICNNITNKIRFSLSAKGFKVASQFIQKNESIEYGKAANPSKKLICNKCGADDLFVNNLYNPREIVSGGMIESLTDKKPFPSTFVRGKIACPACGNPLVNFDGKFREGILQS